MTKEYPNKLFDAVGIVLLLLNTSHDEYGTRKDAYDGEQCVAVDVARYVWSNGEQKPKQCLLNPTALNLFCGSREHKETKE